MVESAVNWDASNPMQDVQSFMRSLRRPAVEAFAPFRVPQWMVAYCWRHGIVKLTENGLVLSGYEIPVVTTP